MDFLAITDDRWKCIWYPEGACEQLFDLLSDSEELKDLCYVKEYNDKKYELQRELIKGHQSRKSIHIEDGKLVSRQVRNESEAGLVVIQIILMQMSVIDVKQILLIKYIGVENREN